MIQLVQLAKPSPVRPPGLGGGKAVRPLLSPLSFVSFSLAELGGTPLPSLKRILIVLLT